MSHGLKLLLLLLELILLLPDNLEILKLPHKLVHGALLDLNQLLETINLRVFLEDPPLCSIELFTVLVLHLLFKVFNVLFIIVMLRLILFLSNIEFLLKETLLGL